MILDTRLKTRNIANYFPHLALFFLLKIADVHVGRVRHGGVQDRGAGHVP